MEKQRNLALCALKARAEKRERNVAAILGETVGKGAAKERRGGVKIAWTDAVRKGMEVVDAKVAAEARRTGGANLEANEELKKKKKLMHEMMVDAYVGRVCGADQCEREQQVQVKCVCVCVCVCECDK